MVWYDIRYNRILAIHSAIKQHIKMSVSATNASATNPLADPKVRSKPVNVNIFKPNF